MRIILRRISNSEAPGNKGRPKNNSATIHPNDHMSMAVLYLENAVKEHSFFLMHRSDLIGQVVTQQK